MLDETTDLCHDIACTRRLGIAPMIRDIGNKYTSSDILTNDSHYGLEGDSWQQSITTPSWILHKSNHIYFSSVSATAITSVNVAAKEREPCVAGASGSPSFPSNYDVTSLSWISSSITNRHMKIQGIQAHDGSLNNWTPSPMQSCLTRVYGANPTAAEHPEALKGDRCHAIHTHTIGRRIPQEGTISYEVNEARKCGNNDSKKQHKQQKLPDTSAAAATASSTSVTATGWNRMKLTKARTRRRKMRTSGSF